MPLHQQLRAFIKANATQALTQKQRKFDEYKNYLSSIEQEEKTLRAELNDIDLSEKEISDIQAELAQLQGVRFGILWALGIVDTK